MHIKNIFGLILFIALLFGWGVCNAAEQPDFSNGDVSLIVESMGGQAYVAPEATSDLPATSTIGSIISYKDTGFSDTDERFLEVSRCYSILSIAVLTLETHPIENCGRFSGDDI